MAQNPDSDLAEIAVLNGGPMDGREHPIGANANELCVVMTDGHQHRYVRTEDVHTLPAAARRWYLTGLVAATGRGDDFH